MITTLILTLALAVSGGPTPYDVTAEGLTLPDGRVFGYEDVQDANFRTTDGRSINLHFEQGKSHALAGSNFVSWEALGFASGQCVEWVQLHGFNEHFGEGGQDPVCVPTDQNEAPEPEPEPIFTEICEDYVPDSGPHGPCPSHWPSCTPTHCVEGWEEPEVGISTPSATSSPIPADEQSVVAVDAHAIEDYDLPQLADTGSKLGKIAATSVFLVVIGAVLSRKKGSL